MKDKFKLIKGILKEWHQQHSQNLEGKKKMVRERISSLDTKGDESALVDDEVTELLISELAFLAPCSFQYELAGGSDDLVTGR